MVDFENFLCIVYLTANRISFNGAIVGGCLGLDSTQMDAGGRWAVGGSGWMRSRAIHAVASDELGWSKG